MKWHTRCRSIPLVSATEPGDQIARCRDRDRPRNGFPAPAVRPGQTERRNRPPCVSPACFPFSASSPWGSPPARTRRRTLPRRRRRRPPATPWRRPSRARPRPIRRPPTSPPGSRRRHDGAPAASAGASPQGRVNDPAMLALVRRTCLRTDREPP